MKVFVRGQGVVHLDKRHFVAKGGEGDIYVRGDVAYKLFHEPSKALPLSKIVELSRIADDRVIKPETVVLAGPRGAAIGYAMTYVRDAEPLCRLFTRSFKERHGLDAPAVYRLIEELTRRVRSVHAAGALVVDLNEMNFLVQLGKGAVFAIDADSYQTPSHPASAIMPSIRDPRTERAPFDQLSDWFSFAVLSFQLLVGVHPYKGKHPRVTTLEERMRQHLSVLGPDVTVPPVAFPFDIIPPEWRAFYSDVLERGERRPPPSSMTGTPLVTVAAPLASQAELTSELLIELDATILALSTHGDHLTAITAEGVFTGERRVHGPVPPGATVVTTPLGHAVVAFVEGGLLVLLDVHRGLRLETEVAAEAVTTARDRLYVKHRDMIVEVLLRDVGATVIASARIAAKVPPHATTLFDGVALSSLLGATYASLFPASGVHHQLRLAELDGVVVLGARADGDDRQGTVLGVLARDRSGQDLRYVFRVAADGARYDVAERPLAVPVGVSLAVLDSGVAVLLGESGELEVFPAAVGAGGRRNIAASLCGDVHLAGHRGQLVCTRDRRVYRLTSHGQSRHQSEPGGKVRNEQAPSP